MADRNLSLALAVKKRMGGRHTEKPVGVVEQGEPKPAMPSLLKRSPAQIVAAIRAKKEQAKDELTLEPELPDEDSEFRFDDDLPELEADTDPVSERREMLSKIMQGLGKE